MLQSSACKCFAKLILPKCTLTEKARTEEETCIFWNKEIIKAKEQKCNILKNNLIFHSSKIPLYLNLFPSMSPVSTLLDVITDKASILKWQVPTRNTVQEVLTSITF